MTIGVTVLGSTGSVGINALDVISRHHDRYHIDALSAHKNTELLLVQCKQYRPKRVVMVDTESAREFRHLVESAGLAMDVLDGEEGLTEVAREDGDIVVCGIVGGVGLLSTIAAVKAGKKVLIANKEPLVMLGQYIVDLAKKHDACLLPLDSEHNAIFQCLPQNITDANTPVMAIEKEHGVKKIMLTGSGGPFRTTPVEKFSTITPDEACAHPNWKMGRKISVDSATMMNKGLELIEACVLFGVDQQEIDIVIHPQSVIHSMVEYIDGSVIAQLGSPDMRVPIANALAWPERIQSGASSLDLFLCQRFDFERPDHDRFPALDLARYAAERKGSMPIVMNAANEVAVIAFLQEKIGFDRIPGLVELAMEKIPFEEVESVDQAIEIDLDTRRLCESSVSKRVLVDYKGKFNRSISL